MSDNTNHTQESHDKKSRGLITRPSFKQRIQIIDLLRAWKDGLLEERPHVNVVAERMSKELGFPITGDTVRSIRKAIGLNWKPKFSPGRGGGKLSKLGVHRRIRTMELQIDALRTAILNICDRVGEAYPVMIDNRDWPTPETVSMEPDPKLSS